MKRCYLVMSPVYSETIPILDDGSGPTEDAKDVLYVWAQSARRARVMFVRAWRRRYAGRSNKKWMEDGNPFRGIIVQRLSEATECVTCGGSGEVEHDDVRGVTRDMAIDAGEPDMEGMPMSFGTITTECPACAGTGEESTCHQS